MAHYHGENEWSGNNKKTVIYTEDWSKYDEKWERKGSASLREMPNYIVLQNPYASDKTDTVWRSKETFMSHPSSSVSFEVQIPEIALNPNGLSCPISAMQYEWAEDSGFSNEDLFKTASLHTILRLIGECDNFTEQIDIYAWPDKQIIKYNNSDIIGISTDMNSYLNRWMTFTFNFSINGKTKISLNNERLKVLTNCNLDKKFNIELVVKKADWSLNKYEPLNTYYSSGLYWASLAAIIPDSSTTQLNRRNLVLSKPLSERQEQYEMIAKEAQVPIIMPIREVFIKNIKLENIDCGVASFIDTYNVVSHKVSQGFGMRKDHMLSLWEQSQSGYP